MEPPRIPGQFTTSSGSPPAAKAKPVAATRSAIAAGPTTSTSSPRRRAARRKGTSGLRCRHRRGKRRPAPARPPRLSVRLRRTIAEHGVVIVGCRCSPPFGTTVPIARSEPSRILPPGTPSPGAATAGHGPADGPTREGAFLGGGGATHPPAAASRSWPDSPRVSSFSSQLHLRGVVHQRGGSSPRPTERRRRPP
jgi:hypothetical protein